VSADNWAVCPRCYQRARDEYDEKVAAVMSSYGRVPVEEFDAARAKLEEPQAEQFTRFREDYEFYGAETGTLTVSYKGRCAECGLELAFKDERRFWPDGDAVRP
jgi:hypothetical protein